MWFRECKENVTLCADCVYESSVWFIFYHVYEPCNRQSHLHTHERVRVNVHLHCTSMCAALRSTGTSYTTYIIVHIHCYIMSCDRMCTTLLEFTRICTHHVHAHVCFKGNLYKLPLYKCNYKQGACFTRPLLHLIQVIFHHMGLG